MAGGSDRRRLASLGRTHRRSSASRVYVLQIDKASHRHRRGHPLPCLLRQPTPQRTVVFSPSDFAVFHVGEDVRSPDLDVLDGLRIDVDRQLLLPFPPFENYIAVGICNDMGSDPSLVGRQSIFVEIFDPRVGLLDRVRIWGCRIIAVPTLRPREENSYLSLGPPMGLAEVPVYRAQLAITDARMDGIVDRGGRDL